MSLESRLGENLHSERCLESTNLQTVFSLRAKITNTFLDIHLFLIFIVSHTELNKFGLVL